MSSCMFVATTSNPNGIDEALRRPGRLDVELSYRLPLPDERVVILESLLGFKSSELTSYARTRCSGFTLSKLSSLADTYALTSAFPEDASFTSSENKNEDVAGLSNIKLRLSQTIEWPLKYPKRFQHFGLSASRGLLLYGPPGTGKTSLVRSIANTSGATLLVMSGADLYSPYVGESERLLRNVFERARRTIPSILFLDELDALVGKRSNNKADPIQQRILATMLMEMDGVSSANGLIVVAATNRPDLIDEALRRPGRFDRTLYVPPPRTLEECAQVFDLYTKNMPLSGVDRGEVRTVVSRRALELELTGAEIRAVCVRAGISALRRSADEVVLSDFMDSFCRDDEKEKSSGRFEWWEKFSRGSHG